MFAFFSKSTLCKKKGICENIAMTKAKPLRYVSLVLYTPKEGHFVNYLNLDLVYL